MAAAFCRITKQKLNDIAKVNFIPKRNSRSKPFIPVTKKRYRPKLYYSLQERLNEKNDILKRPQLYERVNIGFSYNKQNVTNAKKQLKLNQIRNDTDLEERARTCTLEVDLNEIEKEWRLISRTEDLKLAAENSDIYKSLFGQYAFFYPVKNVDILYDFDDELVSPVHAGNLLKPRESASKPHILFDSKADTLWTLLFIDLDGNLYDNDEEMILWFLGNINGSDISSAETVIEYMRPIPPRGTGFHRCTFVLYKQEQKIDYSQFKLDANCLDLKKRNFKNIDFYRNFEDSVTPAGLAWFQCDYDTSLQDFYHKILNMKEPKYEYEFPPPYIAPQVHYPHLRPFNRYLDLHRDPKETQKIMLLKRLSRVNPLEGEPKLLPYPQAVPLDYNQSIWIKNEEKEERDGIGKYRDVYRGDDRPRIRTEKPTSFPFTDDLNV